MHSYTIRSFGKSIKAVIWPLDDNDNDDDNNIERMRGEKKSQRIK